MQWSEESFATRWVLCNADSADYSTRKVKLNLFQLLINCCQTLKRVQSDPYQIRVILVLSHHNRCGIFTERDLLIYRRPLSCGERKEVDGISTKVDLNVAKSSFNDVMYQD